MRWLGWVYEDERGEIWVSPQESPGDLVPLREARSPLCGQHGCLRLLCDGQYHAPGREKPCRQTTQ